MTRCVRVLKADGERARKALIDAGVLDLAHRIESDGDHLLIPVTGDAPRYEVVDFDAKVQIRQETDYKLVAEVPDEARASLPSAFDIIGDIAVMKIDEPLKRYSRKIGEALMRTLPSIRAVFDDAGVRGEFRVRGLTKICGEGGSETVHRENGARMVIDPSLVYFNPRLATERMRVAGMVMPGETIIDMFAGVAPFGCVISRNAEPGRIYSIDLNPECGRFMEENIRLNHISCMTAMIGDAKEVTGTLPKADRVIMNLPQMADMFLQDALGCVKPSGMIHMHKILERSDFEDFGPAIIGKMGDLGHPIRIVHVEELKNYSPTKSVYVFDIVPQ